MSPHSWDPHSVCVIVAGRCEVYRVMYCTGVGHSCIFVYYNRGWRGPVSIYWWVCICDGVFVVSLGCWRYGKILECIPFDEIGTRLATLIVICFEDSMILVTCLSSKRDFLVER